MRLFFATMILISAMAWAQTDTTSPVPDGASIAPTESGQENPHVSQTPEVMGHPASTNTAEQTPPRDPNAITIPAGTKIPLSLAQAISTKNAREGDAVYATTAFPFVLDNQVVIPAGSYIQGVISHVERAKRMKGRAEILMHFTSMIYPNGYTVMLPGSVENTPGADNKSVKDSEGTIQQDSDKGKRIEDAAKGGAVGTVAGATAGGLAAGGLNGARVGAGLGAAAGIGWALMKHGSELRLEAGSSIEMEIQRAITVDGSRITLARSTP